MFKLHEPTRGINLLKNLYIWMKSSPLLTKLIPILSDIFVFIYPIYLVCLYLYGKFKKKIEYKKAALFIFTATLASVIANIIIQYFFDKVRPNFILGLQDQKVESILHKFLPSSSFPSDHAAVGIAMAMATLLRGISHKDKKYIWFSIPLFIFSIIMSFSRITIAVHRPTDIIAGSLIGIMIPALLINETIYKKLDKVFTRISRIF